MAAFAVLVVLSHLLFAQLTFMLAIVFTVVGKASRWRPWWLAARILIAALIVVTAQVVAPGDAAVWALGTGAVTWLVRTGRWDLAPRARR